GYKIVFDDFDNHCLVRVATETMASPRYLFAVVTILAVLLACAKSQEYHGAEYPGANVRDDTSSDVRDTRSKLTDANPETFVCRVEDTKEWGRRRRASPMMRSLMRRAR
ncbi:unnamed protein product, partial [Owenia fusiformis]